MSSLIATATAFPMMRQIVSPKVSHKSVEADLNAVHVRFHALTSSPEGPAAPSIFRTALQISDPSIIS